MSELLTDVEIEAPPEVVWAAFSNFQAYGWQSFFTFSQPSPSEGLVGQNFDVQIFNGGKIHKFQPKLIKFAPNDEMRWVGRLFSKHLFQGEHFFQVQPLGPGRTKFVHGELFKGCLVPLLGGVFKDTRVGFCQYNADLKKHVEEVQAATAATAAS